MKKATAILLLISLLLSALPALGAGEEEALLKGRESWNQVVTVNGRNYLLFAQNSPEWEDMRANNDSDNPQSVGVSACVPFTFATVMANAVPYEMLPLIADQMRQPPRIDQYSATAYYGKRASQRFEISRGCDYLRYWPLVMASFAAGNNISMQDNPQGLFYFGMLTNYFSVKQVATWEVKEAFAALDEGAMVIANFYADINANGATIGHYFTFVSRDEEYAYMLDCRLKLQFPQPMGRYVETLQPGVERIRIADLSKVNLSRLIILWPREDFVPYTPESYQAIIDESNQME